MADRTIVHVPRPGNVNPIVEIKVRKNADRDYSIRTETNITWAGHSGPFSGHYPSFKAASRAGRQNVRRWIERSCSPAHLKAMPKKSREDVKIVREAIKAPRKAAS